MKTSIPPAVAIGLIVLVVAIAVGIGMMATRPKGLGNPKAAIVQGRNGPPPQQPFIPKAGGGQVAPEEAGRALGSTGQPPVAQGGGNVPQQPFIPGGR